MMVVGVGSFDKPPEEVHYMWFTKMFFNKVVGDPECGVQPLINRVRRQMLDADPEKVRVNLFWWGEVNHGPFQLLVNPALNFVGADHIALFGAPQTSHVESQIDPPEDWKDRIAMESVIAADMGLGLAPFVARADKTWIPNPLIAVPEKEVMPKLIICSVGNITMRIKGQDFPCEGESFTLPEDGQFFLRFESQSLFFLAFTL
jgi:hypothetical protein